MLELRIWKLFTNINSITRRAIDHILTRSLMWFVSITHVACVAHLVIVSLVSLTYVARHSCYPCHPCHLMMLENMERK